jgi:hypothetical protein
MFTNGPFMFIDSQSLEGKKQVCAPLQEHVTVSLFFILCFLPTSKRGFLVSISYRHSGQVHVLLSQGTTQYTW